MTELERYLADMQREIADLRREVERLKSWDTGRVEFTNQVVRVLDDNVTRTAPYTADIQVTGVGGLPSKIRGIFYNMSVVAAAANYPYVIVENPDHVAGADTYFAQTAGTIGSIGGFVSLSSLGQLRVNLNFQSYTRLIIDVWAYLY